MVTKFLQLITVSGILTVGVLSISSCGNADTPKGQVKTFEVRYAYDTDLQSGCENFTANTRFLYDLSAAIPADRYYYPINQASMISFGTGDVIDVDFTSENTVESCYRINGNGVLVKNIGVHSATVH